MNIGNFIGLKVDPGKIKSVERLKVRKNITNLPNSEIYTTVVAPSTSSSANKVVATILPIVVGFINEKFSRNWIVTFRRKPSKRESLY